jgi:hypothetical protein
MVEGHEFVSATMDLRSLRTRIDAVEARLPAPAEAECSTPPMPPQTPEVERALLDEILAERRMLIAAVDRLPPEVRARMPADPLRFRGEHWAELDRAGVLDADLVARIIALGRVLREGARGVIMVRAADGTLSDADAEHVRAAEAEGRAVLCLPQPVPIEEPVNFAGEGAQP